MAIQWNIIKGITIPVFLWVLPILKWKGLYRAYDRVWEFEGSSQHPAYHVSGEQNRGKSRRRSWLPVRRRWRYLNHGISKCNVYVTLLGIVLKLDSDSVGLRPDSPNRLLGDGSAAGGMSRHRLRKSGSGCSGNSAREK